ncbi:MAG: cellulase family glycosylhydrolase [Sporocytophaga sp.]|nr:cellulase family glycosylhydrolase [Sporocytophaga sp.]
MKKTLLVMHFLLLLAVLSRAQTPLSMNGRLSVTGGKLVNECGTAVQLRGLSTHGVMFHQECYTESSVKSIAQDWKADLLRLAIYTENSDGATKGFAQATDKEFYYQWIDKMVSLTEKYGIYVIIDWHILKDGNPGNYQSQAKAFFTLMSSKYKDKKHVIYEICNEPNGGTSWGTIKSYAEDIIPAIRNNDPNAVILVGTPEWSSRIDQARSNPLSGNNAKNVMYTLHFYAGSGAHNQYKNYLRDAVSANFPVFISEWGTTEASGAGNIDSNNSRDWLSLLEQNKISWANWQFSDKNESSSLLKEGSCIRESWINFRTDNSGNSGKLIYDELRKTKNYTTCGTVTIPVTPTPPVCPNATGSNLNIYGCPVTNTFNTNYCEGYNTKQAYVRTDFSKDTVPYFTYWKKPSEGSTVYSAVIQNEKLVITSVNADPNYSTFGFDFGKLNATTHVPIDLRANAVLKFDVSFQKTNYSANDISLYIEMVDANDISINASALGAYNRFVLPVDGTTKTIVADFTKGVKRTPAEGGTSGNPKEDTFDRTTFDFSKVTKITIWVNPDVSGVYKRPPFTGTWTIDNFSLGYDETKAVSCDEYVDVDLCPEDPNKTKPGKCGCGVPEDGCDCNGVAGGTAFTDLCGVCVGGNTGKAECDGNSYTGTPYPIPGTIEAENFDKGGQGVGYYDITEGQPASSYRPGDNVFTELAGGSTNNWNVGYTSVGEWLNYTVDVKYPGTYHVSFRAASERATGKWHLEVDGQKIPNSDFSLSSTGGWQTYSTLKTTQPITLKQGKQVIRLVFDGADANIDNMIFEADEVITSIPVKAASKVTVYPMPANGLINISQEEMSYNKVVMMDMTGNVIKTKTLSGLTEELPLQNVSRGIYMLELTGAKGSEHVRVVVE